MKFLSLAAAVLGLTATSAFAGSIQRAGDGSQILFERGKNYVEFSAIYADADISGVGTGPFAGTASGDIANSFLSFSAGFKTRINKKLTFALVGSNPVGADVSYPISPYFFSGSTAEITSTALTGYLRYDITDRFHVYGGLRATNVNGNVNLVPGTPFNYTLNVRSDIGWGYVLGAAFTIEEIFMKFALTYESKTEHDFIDNAGTPFTVEIPQAVTLHARSAVSEKMLVFGSIRWQEWSEFQVGPNDFLTNPLNTAGLPIAFGAGDYITYEIGVARRFTEKLAVVGTYSHEPSQGALVGNLEGRNGFDSYGLGVIYSPNRKYDITAGVRYIQLGDATTTTIGSRFSGNDALAFGLKLGYRF
ncbi:MAG: outer membrane protein transport protein [Pseudomonadota bacterium]